MQPLIGPYLKLRRAQKHLNALKQAIQRFLKSNPYAFVLEPNPDPPDYILRAKINKVPSIEWSAIVGDFAHNARSALDLLIFQISTLSADDLRRIHLQFPICDYPTKTGKISGYAEQKKHYLAGVSDEYTKIIERYQPYHRQDGFQNDALGLLANLNNTDKHRIIQVVGAVANFRGLGLSGYGSSLDIKRMGPNTPMNGGPHAIVSTRLYSIQLVGTGVITEDGAVVANLTIPDPSKVNMQPGLEIAIKFGEGSSRVQGRPVTDTLTFILNRVKEVLREFE